MKVAGVLFCFHDALGQTQRTPSVSKKVVRRPDGDGIGGVVDKRINF